MKRVFYILLFFGLTAAANQPPIQFHMKGELTHQYRTKPFGDSFLIISKTVSGVNLEIKSADPNEVLTARKIVQHLQKNLKFASSRIFTKDPNNIIITTGKRHAPSPEELDAVLKEVTQLIEPLVKPLRLYYVQSVRVRP